MPHSAPYWETKSLAEMTPKEWEQLCDGCGQCCVHAFEDEDTGELAYTDVACELLNVETCRCRDYPHRKQKVPSCLTLTVDTIAAYHWLPSSCAYRLLYNGQTLPEWHYLRSGDPDSVHKAGQSVSGQVVSGAHIHSDDYEERIVRWVIPT